MPEGPEVEYWVEYLNNKTKNLFITDVYNLPPTVLDKGQSVFFLRNGKEMWICLTPTCPAVQIRFGINGTVVNEFPTEQRKCATDGNLRFFALCFATFQFGIVIPVGSHGSIQCPEVATFVPPAWGPDFTQLTAETFWLLLSSVYSKKNIDMWLRNPKHMTGFGKRHTSTALRMFGTTTWPATLEDATQLFTCMKSVWNHALTRYRSLPTLLEYPAMRSFL